VNRCHFFDTHVCQAEIDGSIPFTGSGFFAFLLSGLIRNLVAISVFVLISAPAIATEFTGYLTLTTDYVYRGVTRSDGHGAIQLGADVSLESGLYAGVWGSTIDIGDGVTRQRDLEINYYAGYSYNLSDRWIIGASVVAFTFPGALGSIDYDHEEYSAYLNYDDRIWFEYSQSPDYYNSGVRTHNYELFAEWPVVAPFSLSAGIGHYDVADFSGRAYTYWQLGITRPLGKFDIDLRYHDTDRWVPLVSSPERAEARLALSARFQF
jgi:uncharacterized protein (TIGR02001 family)